LTCEFAEVFRKKIKFQVEVEVNGCIDLLSTDEPAKKPTLREILVQACASPPTRTYSAEVLEGEFWIFSPLSCVTAEEIFSAALVNGANLIAPSSSTQ
jgi:hypothetical protein